MGEVGGNDLRGKVRALGGIEWEGIGYVHAKAFGGMLGLQTNGLKNRGSASERG
jgi:hypothetical protein